MCYPEQMFNKQKNKLMISIYHQKRINEIRKLLADDQRLVEIWEHAWMNMCKTIQNVSQFIESENIREPLVPRDAFYGGRTEAFYLHKVAPESGEIIYVDVVSLYPLNTYKSV